MDAHDRALDRALSKLHAKSHGCHSSSARFGAHDGRSVHAGFLSRPWVEQAFRRLQNIHLPRPLSVFCGVARAAVHAVPGASAVVSAHRIRNFRTDEDVQNVPAALDP